MLRERWGAFTPQEKMKIDDQIMNRWTFLASQWLRLCTTDARGLGLILRQDTKIPQATSCDQKEKNKPAYELCGEKGKKPISGGDNGL